MLFTISEISNALSKNSYFDQESWSYRLFESVPLLMADFTSHREKMREENIRKRYLKVIHVFVLSAVESSLEKMRMGIMIVIYLTQRTWTNL